MELLASWPTFLALLAVFGLGWALARIDIEEVARNARRVPDLVMDGIRSLLEGDVLAAAERFADPSTPLGRDNAKLHFAAGELFRRKGHHEQAMRVHKQLLSCDDLSKEDHARARYELGLDYQMSGYLDLAERCYSELEGTAHSAQAMLRLLEIHVYSKDWQQAIRDEERFAGQESNSELRRNIIAQFYCEWAATEGPERKVHLLEQAARQNPNCWRVPLMRAEDALARGDHAAALGQLAVIDKRPELVLVAAGLLMRAHVEAGTQEEGEARLVKAFMGMQTPLMFCKVYDALAEVRGKKAMADFVRMGLDGAVRDPALAAKWLETEHAHASGARRDEIVLLLESVSGSVGRFTCSSCGNETQDHFWRCPFCYSWETMLPGGDA